MLYTCSALQDDSKPILIEIGNDGSTGYVSVDGVRKDGLQGHENLHCDVARPFRIKWHEKKITISRGTTFQDIIFDQVVGSLQSNAYWFLGFGDGNNETATWMLHVQMGKEMWILLNTGPYLNVKTVFPG